MCYHAVRNSDCLFVCKNRTFLVFFVFLPRNQSCFSPIFCFPFSVQIYAQFCCQKHIPRLVLCLCCLPRMKIFPFAKIAFLVAFVSFYQCFQALPFSCHNLVQVSSLLFFCCLYKNCSSNFRHCFSLQFLVIFNKTSSYFT